MSTTKKSVPGSSKGPTRKPVPQYTAQTPAQTDQVQMTHPVERRDRNLLADEVDENAGGDDHTWSETEHGVS